MSGCWCLNLEIWGWLSWLVKKELDPGCRMLVALVCFENGIGQENSWTCGVVEMCVSPKLAGVKPGGVGAYATKPEGDRP